MSARPFHPQIRMPLDLPKTASPRPVKAQGVSAWELGASKLPRPHPEVNPQPASGATDRVQHPSEPIPPAVGRSPLHPEENATPQAGVVLARSEAMPATRPWQWSRRWTIVSVMVLGVVGIGLIPLADTVTGEATILSAPGERQVITTQRAARVRAIYVRQNDWVRKGQLLAELVSDDLEQTRMEGQRKLAEARSERETARQYLALTIQKGEGAQLQRQSSALRAAQLQAEVDGLTTGNPSPRIRQLQGQQQEKERQIQGIAAQLQIMQAQLERYQGLVQAGALPLVKLDELRREMISLQTQQNTLEAQIQTLDHQVATTQKEMTDELQGRRQPEVAATQVALRMGHQEVEAARATLQKWTAQVQSLEVQAQHLQRQADGLKLRATVAGVVMTGDLDLLEGQQLPEGKEILTLAQTTQPTLRVELPQSEARRVRSGMAVTFRPQDGGLEGYEGKVLAVPPVTTPPNEAQPQQKAMVGVNVRLEEGQPLTLGTKGYAHVQLGQTCLYQKIGREVLKLIPLGRFF